jgi:glycosyltransferase involved in cell wall biosynthesis
LEDETPSELAKRLIEIANMPRQELKALGSRAQEYVRMNRTWESNMVRLENYLKEVGKAA